MIRFFAVLLCSVVLVGWTGSQPQHRDGPRRYEHAPERREMFMELREKLELTDEQEEKLRSIRIEFKRSEIESKACLATNRIDLMEMLRGIEIDRPQIEKKVEEIGRIRTELELSRIDAVLKARDIFTTEQLEKFGELGFPMMRLFPREERMRFRH